MIPTGSLRIQGQVETARAIGDRTVDTDAQPFAEYDALPELKRSARLTDAQKQTDQLKQYEGRKLEVLWIEDSRGELEPATLDSIDRNITDEYTLDDGVWYEGIVDSVTKSYAKVRFDVPFFSLLFLFLVARQTWWFYWRLGRPRLPTFRISFSSFCRRRHSSPL